MKLDQPYLRLKSLWGLIDGHHNACIAAHLAPHSTLLDIGCGYGSLVAYLTEQGHQAMGVDLDPDSVAVAHQLFPIATIKLTSAESLLPDQQNQYDAIILKDAFHHVLGEHDAIQTFQTIHQLLKPHGRVIILDPNPIWLLKFLRKVVRHQDEEATLAEAQAVLKATNFEVKGYEYYEVFGLAVSGGYVGYQLVPNITLLNRTVAALNHLASRFIDAIGLGPWICWRYIIYADKITTSPL